jgi:hypothetical protein
MRTTFLAFTFFIALSSAHASNSYSVTNTSLNFTSPSIYDRSTLTNAIGGDIVYDSKAQAFFGLPPGVDPSASGGTNWLQLSSSVGSSTVSSSAAGVKVEYISADCTTGACVVSRRSNGITGVTYNAAGIYTINVNTGPAPFVNPAACFITPVRAGTSISTWVSASNVAPTTAAYQFVTVGIPSGVLTPIDTQWDAICVGN